MRVTLLEDQKTISEVVVIGYGVQKKSVVTASIAKVDASDLAETAPVRVDTAPMVATCGDRRVAVMFFLCFFLHQKKKCLKIILNFACDGAPYTHGARPRPRMATTKAYAPNCN